ncbi:MAG: hypothetical protein LUF85_04125 [Bacteroides sp.]|nr:hypothetical protein [Bacteroides sp.]
MKDVKEILGVASNDVGYLCANKHGKTNIWSKFKPVKYRSLLGQSYRSTAANYIAEMWKGEDKNCGLGLPNKVSKSGDMKIRAERIRSLYETDDDSYLWSSCYTPPTGGSTYPYRILDFWGYNHEARPFIVRSGNSFQFDLTGSSNDLKVYFTADPGDSTDTLQSYDILGADVNLNEFRLVCAVFDYSNAARTVYSALTPILVNNEISGGGISITLKLKELFASTSSVFTAKLYFALENISEQGWKQGYYRLPEPFGNIPYNHSPVECKILWNTDFKIENVGYDVEVTPNWDGSYFRPWAEISANDGGVFESEKKYSLCSNGDLVLKMTIKNPSNTKSSTNVTAFSAWGHFASKDHTQSPIVTDEKGNRLSSVDIPANGQVTVIMKWEYFFTDARVSYNDTGQRQVIEVIIYKSGARIAGGDINYKWKSKYPDGVEPL